MLSFHGFDLRLLFFFFYSFAAPRLFDFFSSKNTAAFTAANTVVIMVKKHFILTSTLISVNHFSRYKPPVYDEDGIYILSYENTAVFMLTCFLYINSAIAFSPGAPYRKELYTNCKSIITMNDDNNILNLDTPNTSWDSGLSTINLCTLSIFWGPFHPGTI